MSVKKVTIKPGCITCGLCEFIAPELFHVTDISHIKENADFGRYEAALKEATKKCPVQVIFCKEEVDDDTT